MPNLNGTGPMGQGSQTGRGLGNCNPANNSNEQQNIQRPLGGFFRRGGGGSFGRGFGGGFGRGFGGGAGYGMGFSWRANNSYVPPVAYEPQDELQSLTNEAKQMEENLAAMNKRISELEKK